MRNHQRERRRWSTATAATAAVLAALLGLGSLPASAVEPDPSQTETPSPAPTQETPETTAPTETRSPEDADVNIEDEKAPAPNKQARAAGDQTGWKAVITTVSGTPDDADGNWPGNDEPGNDSGPDNDVIRTNDLITWRIQTAPQGGAAVHQTLVLTLPRGTYASQTPPFCVAGPNTSLTPAAADYPAPELPTLADSWTRLPVQTLSCELPADLSVENSLSEFPFEARVRPEVPHGTQLKLEATVKSDDIPDGLDITDAPGNTELTVSAAAKYDLSKNGYASVENTVNIDSSQLPCPWDSSVGCLSRAFYVDIAVPDGNKGISPASTFSFVDDLTPETFYGIDTATNPAWQAAIAAGEDPFVKYGARMVGNAASAPAGKASLQVTGNNQTFSPLGRGAATDAALSDVAVRDSGTALFNAEQIGTTRVSAPGQKVTIDITKADGTAWTYPTSTNRPASLNTKNAPVVSYKYTILVPSAAMKDLGTANATNDAWTLKFHNEYQDFTATDMLGNGNTPGSDASWNDYRETNVTLRLIGPGFDKQFVGVPGTPGNTPPSSFQPSNSSMVGPPGSTVRLAGDGQIYAGQDVVSLITTNNYNQRSETATPNTQMVCDYWDTTKLQLHARDYPGYEVANPASAVAYNQRLGSDGAAVWVSSKTKTGASGQAPIINGPDPSNEHWRGFEAKYTNVAVPGAGWDCAGTSESDWYDAPEDVPGNDPALAAQGIYTAVTGVRLWMQTPSQTTTGNGYTAVSIGLRMVTDPAYPDGTKIPNWATGSGQIIDQSAADYFAADKAWVLSQYDPETHVDAGRGDRVILASIRSTLIKDMKDPQSGNWTQNNTQVTQGQEYTFRLRPSLGAGAGQATTPKLIVEDCLPAALVYVSSSITPVTVSETTPGDAGLKCSTGETYVKWDLGEQNTTDPVPEITYVTQISATAAETTHTNRAMVTAVGDPSAPAQRTDDQQVRVINPAGLKITKRALPPVLELNADPDQEFNHPVGWLIGIANIGPVQGMFDADLIDVLPADGNNSVPDLSGDRTSHFNGSAVEITGATWQTGGDDVTVLYTTADPTTVKVDPLDPSNLPGGSTTWTEWTDLSTAPAGITAVRTQKNGEFTPAGNFELRLTGVAKGNRAGDIYVNGAKGTARSAATGQWTLLGPLSAQTTIIGGTVGDTFWIDANGNGLQDDGEPAVPNATVTLTGTDALGNPIDLSTTTDATGKYSFPNLHSSDDAGYTVTFTIPDALKDEGYEFTSTEAGDDRAVDSNADGIGASKPVVLGPGASDLTVDAGIVKPEIDLVKQADPVSGLDAGDVVTYTFTTTNTGQTTLTGVTLAEGAFKNADGSDLTLDAPPAIDEAASTGTPDALAPGEKIVWTAKYTLTAADLGGLIVNDAKTLGVSPRDNEVNDTDDETVAPKGVGAFTFSKVAEAASGSKVKPGDTVTYTVKVKHNGEGKVDGASISDDLSKVLDDATYNDDVAATAGTAKVENGTLTWTGDLSQGAEVIITYSVTVKTGGDEQLHNAVTTTDERGQCDDEIGCETDHTMEPGKYTFEKSSDPATGSTVKVDGVVTYTVKVKHDASTGSVTGATITDDLSKVLDDADYQGDVEASAGEAKVEGDTLTWTGDLTGGAEVTITYSVKVKSGGDELLHNTVTTTDDRGTCVTAGGCETTHTMGPGTFVYSKTSDPEPGSTVKAGDKVSYTVTVEHRGDGTVKDATVTDDLSQVLDDAKYNDDVEASAGTAQISDGSLVWTGDLKHGDKVTITYSVTVNSAVADGELHNVVTTADDRGVCDTEIGCETDHKVKPGTYMFSKTSDPATGTKVGVDGVIHYTVTVKHAGDGAADVKDATITDDLSKVLDDADYQGDVQASSGTAKVDGTTLTWAGDLASGKEVTITYSVKVKSGGDELLHNTVTTTDDRGSCDAAVGCETTHTMGPGMFVYSKTATPGTGSSVKAGDTIAYTLTVEHRGDGKVTGATVTDDLSKVIDDATYNGDVKASSGKAMVSGSQLTWSGDLAHGDKVTITYSVTVKKGGDRTIANAVTSTDDRGACDPDKACATKHTIPSGLATTGLDGTLTTAGAALALLFLVAGGTLLLHRRRQRQEQ